MRTDHPSSEQRREPTLSSSIVRPRGLSSAEAVASDRVYVGTQDSASLDVYTLDGATWRRGPSAVRPDRQSLTTMMQRSRHR